MYDSVLIYSRHHAPQQTASLFFCCKVGKVRKGVRAFRKHIWNASMESHVASQRSLHYTPIFRLLLKVAVNGTRQCDFLIFCGASVPTNGILNFQCRAFQFPFCKPPLCFEQPVSDFAISCIFASVGSFSPQFKSGAGNSNAPWLFRQRDPE